MPADTLPVSTDIVLFSIRDERLEVLLVREDAGQPWALPGGRAGREEDLDASALRHLAARTGVRGVWLEQLYTFGRPDRDPAQRVIAVAYYALVPIGQLEVGPADQNRDWVPVRALPRLALDHAAIVARALDRLVAKLDYSTIALQFMPARFTLSALQAVYETILGEALDKRNFRKRVLALACIEDTGELSREGHHRPARLYRVARPGTVEFIK